MNNSKKAFAIGNAMYPACGSLFIYASNCLLYTSYLNSYLLIFMIIAAIVGVFVANPQCHLEAFTSFNVDGQTLFPILFVTIACGAVSGFHSLVSSGTASKQIKNEKNMLPVSFGAMLMESMLAIIALIAVASFAKGEAAAQGLTTQPQLSLIHISLS